MRKNTKNVFNAWMNRRSEKKQNSIWTDGVHIYSYNVPIVERLPDGGYMVDVDQYSVTTSVHQNATRHLMLQNGITEWTLKNR